MGYREPSTAKPSWADLCHRAMEGLLISLLAFMPFAFGVVEAWSEQILLFLCAALWAVFAAGLVLSGRSQVRWHWTYVPILAFLLIAVFQWVPLPAAMVQVLSPGTAAARQQLLGDVPELQPHLQTMSLSFYRWATGHDLRLVFAIATVFFVVTNGYRHPAQIRRLLAAISIIGGAVVLLALAQNLLGNGRIYWFVPTGNGIANSGPFINHSHYAQFVNLSMGAALGWLLILLAEDRRDKAGGAAEAADYLRSPQGKRIIAILVLLVLGATTNFLSLSRGGMISMLIAAAFTATVLSLRRWAQGYNWALVAVALLVFTCVLYLGFEAVCDRLATLEDFRQAQNGRGQILEDILVAWTRFPVFGTGLGTHAVVYPMFDRATIPALAGHAENEYAQTAEEMGALGLGALAVFGVLIWTGYVRVVKRAREPMSCAAYGLGFGLLAVLVHSFSDFGQHVPANAALSAVFCALLICLDCPTASEKPPRPAAATVPSGLPRYTLMVPLACSCGLWIWVLSQADQSRRAEMHWAKASDAEAQMIEADWQQADAAYADLITHAARASNLEPGNIHYRHWLNVYRWRSIARTTDPNGMVLLDDQALESVRKIAQDLREAALLCPLFGPTWCVLGQLEYGVLGEDRGLDHVRKSLQLSPNDPTVCLVAGLTEIGLGQPQEGLTKLRRAVQLDSRLYPEVARACVRDLQSARAAMDLAEGQTHRLTQLAGILAEEGADGALVQEIQDRIVDLLGSRCNDPETPASCFAALGWIHEKRQDTSSAVQCFREALARDYGQVRYHLTLARLLADAGELEEAMHEARVCLRLSPQYEPAERLVGELSVRRTSPADGIALQKTGSR